MSLDNTSHPGRPGPDELVPSRYALRVGEIDVLVVSDGVLSLPGAMLGHNVDPADPVIFFVAGASWAGAGIAYFAYLRRLKRDIDNLSRRRYSHGHSVG